jgi:hypothetical protein
MRRGAAPTLHVRDDALDLSRTEVPAAAGQTVALHPNPLKRFAGRRRLLPRFDSWGPSRFSLGCKATPDATRCGADTGRAVSRQNIEGLRQAYERFNATGRLPLSALTDDFVQSTPNEVPGDVLHGRDAWAAQAGTSPTPSMSSASRLRTSSTSANESWSFCAFVVVLVRAEFPLTLR